MQRKHLNTKTFFKYSTVGLMGTVVDFGSLLFLVEVMGVYPSYANIIAVSLAILHNYYLNRMWTYKDHERSWKKTLTKFILISLIGLLMNAILLPLFLSLGLWYVFAKIIIIGIVVFWNFLGNSLWTFRKTA